MKQKLKNVTYFLPAVISLIFYIILACVSGFGSLNPMVWFFLALLFVAAILMLHKKWWGCFAGLLTGVYLIYMGTQYTGQTVNIEMPIGIVMCAYYVMCGILCFGIKKPSEAKKE